jgi:hypothetical protein
VAHRIDPPSPIRLNVGYRWNCNDAFAGPWQARQGIPGTPHDDKAVWHNRYHSIANLEKHLHGNGMRLPASSCASS